MTAKDQKKQKKHPKELTEPIGYPDKPMPKQYLLIAAVAWGLWMVFMMAMAYIRWIEWPFWPT